MLNNNYEPHYFDGNTNFEGTSIQINNFLKTNINTLIIPKLFFELNEDNLYNNARNKILKFLNVSSIDEYIKKNNQGDLFKLAEKEMGKGGNYTPLGNSEFELFGKNSLKISIKS